MGFSSLALLTGGLILCGGGKGTVLWIEEHRVPSLVSTHSMPVIPPPSRANQTCLQTLPGVPVEKHWPARPLSASPFLLNPQGWGLWAGVGAEEIQKETPSRPLRCFQGVHAALHLSLLHFLFAC